MKTRPQTYPETWKRVTVRTLRAGQPRPYADEVNEYLVTFEGGTPSSEEGAEIPFAVMRPPGPPSPNVVFMAPPHEVRAERHMDRIKEIVQAIARPWDTDSTKGEQRRMGGSWLETFALVDEGDFHATYRVVVKIPYMD